MVEMTQQAKIGRADDERGCLEARKKHYAIENEQPAGLTRRTEKNVTKRSLY